MKLFFFPALLFCLTTGHCQFTANNSNLPDGNLNFNHLYQSEANDFGTVKSKIKIDKANRWKLSNNKLITGGLLVLSGAAKGFNETLEFNWHGFAAVFPKANPKWFYPQQSFKNKYKDGDRTKGEKFPLSSSVLVMLTDQYHLNNFIHRGAITAALVVKIGEGKKPFLHYVIDVLYYTLCYQAGFGGVYYYFKSRM
jgi:GR25 family glycosyltransferase involved in LPS biosynthesis